ncbi:methyl-accepting chemotaxis protein [Paenibacillus sp. FSL K6-2862]|uniref:methyl-accepting chemotaxis protein n=1 Tax=Paenibacillus sp. FSL K6-2862 TaxID=2921484 RepID=UPI0030FD1978
MVETDINVLDYKSAFNALEQSLAMICFNSDGKVIWVNEKFATTMEYQATQMVGISHRQLCTPEFANSRDYDSLWEHLREGKIFQEKIQRVTKHGRILWLEATYTPITNEVGSVEKIIKVATDITDRVERNGAKLTKDLQSTANNLMYRANEGIARASEITQAMKDNVRMSDEHVQILASFENEVTNIHDIVINIHSLAKTTNMLALNAAIEAAHAGEHGLGFNVVAQEVGKLSKQVHHATNQVNTIVEGITEQVVNISAKTKRSKQAICHTQSLVEGALQEFTSINDSANQLHEQTKELVNLI